MNDWQVSPWHSWQVTGHTAMPAAGSCTIAPTIKTGSSCLQGLTFCCYIPVIMSTWMILSLESKLEFNIPCTMIFLDFFLIREEIMNIIILFHSEHSCVASSFEISVWCPVDCLWDTDYDFAAWRLCNAFLDASNSYCALAGLRTRRQTSDS